MVKLLGIEVQGNPDNSMGLEVHTQSHRFGFQNPNGRWFQDTKIERIHDMEKPDGLSQRITTTMHVLQGTTFIDEGPCRIFLARGSWWGCPGRNRRSSRATTWRRPAAMRTGPAMC